MAPPMPRPGFAERWVLWRRGGVRGVGAGDFRGECQVGVDRETRGSGFLGNWDSGILGASSSPFPMADLWAWAGPEAAVTTQRSLGLGVPDAPHEVK